MKAGTLAALLEPEGDNDVFVRVDGRLYEIRMVRVQYDDDENGNSGIFVVLETEEKG